MEWKNLFRDFEKRDFLLLILVSAFSLIYIFYPLNIDWEWVYKWQTLIAGFLAVLAACITIYVTWRIHDQTRVRKRESIKAYMDDALKELGDYCKSCFFYIDEADTTLPAPKPNSGHIEVFKKYIEYAKNSEIEPIRALISDYQVYNSRLKHFSEIRTPKDNKIQEGLVLTVNLNASIINLFDFARGKDRFGNVVKVIMNEKPTEKQKWSSYFSLSSRSEGIAYSMSKNVSQIAKIFE